MKNRIQILVCGAVLVGAISTSAIAGFQADPDVLEAAQKPEAPAKESADAPVPRALVATAVVGDSAKLQKHNGFGNEVRLKDAIRRIVPESWTIAGMFDSAADRKVSWKGGAPWHEVLDSVLAGSGVTASIDVARKRVLIGEPSVASVDASGKGMWFVKPGQQLQTVLRGWVLASGGVDLVWDADKDADVRIMGSSRFVGTLDEAMEQLLTSIQDGSADRRVNMKVRNLRIVVNEGNSVVRVTDRSK